MYKKIVIVFSFLFSFLLLSCNQNNNPVSVQNKNSSVTTGLQKAVWLTSDEYNCYDLDLSFTYNFSFDNYNFSLTYQESLDNYPWKNTIQIKVNNTLCYTLTYYVDINTNLSPAWTDWYSFTFNGVPIQFRLYQEEHSETMSPIYNWISPAKVQVQVQTHELDIPSNFSVSPTVTSDLNQVVTLTWDPSTDNDVTGFEIYRERYYLLGGQVLHTNYSLVYTATSRSTSSWEDSPRWGTDGHADGVGYVYKIRAISSTLNIQSGFTAPYDCGLEGYTQYLP